jgi:uncharacterized protein
VVPGAAIPTRRHLAVPRPAFAAAIFCDGAIGRTFDAIRWARLHLNHRSLPVSTSTQPLRASAIGAPAPVDSDERLHTLDILRGLALGGMILVHFHQRLERPVTGTEDLIGWGVWIFAEQKAWGTFAFLFGVGFAVLLRRLDARGVPVVPIYLRRLAALAAIGLVAQVALGFSVLFEYALWGLVLLLVRRWPTRALLALALLSACARPMIAEGTALSHWWSATPLPPPVPNLHSVAADVALNGTYTHLLASRWAWFLDSVPHRWEDLVPSSNLTLFIVGMLAVRHRVLDEPLRHVRTIAGWMLFGGLSWAISWVVLFNLPEISIPGADWPIKFGLGLIQDQWLCFTYVGAVALWLAYHPEWVERLRAFGFAGRMALTNYLLQAALFDVLASQYGFGIRVRPYLHLLLAPALFAAMAMLSRAWLARYRFGPVEWVWRCVTYARPQRLRRDPRVVAAPGLA